MSAANRKPQRNRKSAQNDTPWIDFSTTENPFGTPAAMSRALSNAIEASAMSKQPDRSALALRRALAQTLLLPEESFLVGTTVSSMIGAVCQAFEPCAVGIMTPCPIEYALTIANTGHKLERIKPGSTFVAPDAQSIAEQGLEINAAILANPGFPTSRLLPESVLISYLEKCDWVIVDERSIELTLGGKSFASLTEQYKNLIVAQSFTEQYALPGAPVSYCIANPDILTEIARFYDTSSITMLPEALAEASVHEHPKLEEVRGFLYSEIPWMQTMLSLIPGIEIFPAEANYVMCALRTSEIAHSSVKTLDDLIERLTDSRCLVKNLEGTPGIGDNEAFCVSVKARQENEQLINTLRSILAS